MKQRAEDHQQQLQTQQDETARALRLKDEELHRLREQFDSKFITQQLALDDAIRRGAEVRN